MGTEFTIYCKFILICMVKKSHVFCVPHKWGNILIVEGRACRLEADLKACLMSASRYRVALHHFNRILVNHV